MKRFLFPILGMWLLLYGSFALVRPPLLDDADALHAEAAREILVTHDWVTLHVNGVRFLEEAPLLYWSTAASISGRHAFLLPSMRWRCFSSSSCSVGASSRLRRRASMLQSLF
jgi:4-amino-4-deoxy-L-arabinose transferase-like glycosyltransferase